MEVVHDLIFGAGVPIKQCQTVSHSNNANPYVGRNSGGAAPAFVGLMSAEPTATFTTMDVAGFVGIFGVAGASVTSGTVTIPYRKRTSGSTYAGTLSHFTMTGANAFGYPTSFTASQDQAASATAEIKFLSTTGLAAPLTTATGATLAAQSYNVSYTLGPAGINGTQVPEITAITVNPGLQVEVRMFNGSPYPESCYVIQTDPTIELTFADFDSIDTYGPIFASNDGNDVTAFFRKMDDGSTRVADATAEHIKFTLSDGLITIPDFSASDTSDGSGTILITGKTLAVTATSAISFA